MKQDSLNEKSTFTEISKSICKIKKDEKNNATGFFLVINYNKKYIFFLVTAYHEIPFTLVENGKQTIEIITDFENIKQNITLNKKERKILCFEKEDITAIEILDTDIIKNKVKFLKYDKKCTKDRYQNYLNIEAFIFHHPNGEKLQCNKGKILEVEKPQKYEFRHNLFTQKGSSGSPILYYKNTGKKPYPRPRVIGVHTSCDPQTKTNIGTFINIFTKEIKAGRHTIEYASKLKIGEQKCMTIGSGIIMNAKDIACDYNSKLVVKGGATLILGPDD